MADGTSTGTGTSTPIHYLLPLYPCFQLLDVAGPLDILNLLSISHPPTKSITLTFIASTLDPVPIKPIPPIDPTTNQPKWTYAATTGLDEGTNLSFNQSLTPTVTFNSLLSAIDASTSSSSSPSSPTTPFQGTSTHHPIDVLLIPGGIGTRLTRISPDGHETPNTADLVDFTRRIAPHVRHSIVTVCTGSAILARAGLLDDRRATTNISVFDTVAASRPEVCWLKARRWVRSRRAGEAPRQQQQSTETAAFAGEIWTSAGISAGIDVMLAFVAEWYGGVEVARTAAKRLEYEWREIGEGEIDPLYGLTKEDLGE